MPTMRSMPFLPLAAVVALAATPAVADEGHDHGTPAPKAAPRAAAPAGEGAAGGDAPGAPKKDHHARPHGGVVKSTSAHRHLELVRRADGVDLYVYDGEMKPLEHAVTDAKIRFQAGKQRTELALTGTGSRLSASGAVPAGKVQALVMAKIDGKAENVKILLE